MSQHQEKSSNLYDIDFKEKCYILDKVNRKLVLPLGLIHKHKDCSITYPEDKYMVKRSDGLNLEANYYNLKVTSLRVKAALLCFIKLVDKFLEKNITAGEEEEDPCLHPIGSRISVAYLSVEALEELDIPDKIYELDLALFLLESGVLWSNANEFDKFICRMAEIALIEPTNDETKFNKAFSGVFNYQFFKDFIYDTKLFKRATEAVSKIDLEHYR